MSAVALDQAPRRVVGLFGIGRRVRRGVAVGGVVDAQATDLTELLDAVARSAGAARGRVLRSFEAINEELAAVEVAEAPLRLTRRGRLVAAALAALLLVGSLVAGLVAASTSTAGARQGWFAAGATGQGSGIAVTVEPDSIGVVRAAADDREVVVRPGDTLWSIASRYLADRDPREVVVALRELNGIDGGALAAGQRLRLPASR